MMSMLSFSLSFFRMRARNVEIVFALHLSPPATSVGDFACRDCGAPAHALNDAQERSFSSSAAR